MAQDAGDQREPADTVEWGDTHAERQSWLVPMTDGASRPRIDLKPGGLNYVAVGLAALGFAFVLAAQYLPWAHVTTGGQVDEFSRTLQDGLRLGVLSGLNGPYNISLGLVLAAVAAALVVGPQMRRLATAAALGMLAGLMALLVGTGSALVHNGSLIYLPGVMTNSETSLGPGFTCAVVATVLFIAAVLAAARGSITRRAKPAAPPPEDEAGPIDLTVTPLPMPNDRAR